MSLHIWDFLLLQNQPVSDYNQSIPLTTSLRLPFLLAEFAFHLDLLIRLAPPNDFRQRAFANYRDDVISNDNSDLATAFGKRRFL
jgi:hypothetical protein